MSFTPLEISVPTNGDANDWPAWGALMVAAIKEAETDDQLSELIALNRETFADCADRAPKAWWSLSDALDRRRRQIAIGVNA